MWGEVWEVPSGKMAITSLRARAGGWNELSGIDYILRGGDEVDNEY